MISNIPAEQRKQFFAYRDSLDSLINKIVDSPVEINVNMVAIRLWKPDKYAVDDVRMYEGIPYKCIQAHDSNQNSTWTPDTTPALWMQYHGTSVDTARPWIAPTGSHDIYKVGEYMIWTDGLIYKCIINTNFSPTEYAQAWEIVN